MLHVTDGESVAGTLRESGVPGEVVIFGDLMYDGRVPLGMPADALARFSEHEETVLWFDHRLSNQLLLIRALDWFSQQDLVGCKLSLISAGRLTLGGLHKEELAALLPGRIAVTADHFAIAGAAWRARATSDRPAIQQIAESGTPALPFLAPALRRYLEDMTEPGTLSRTERQALAVLKEKGPLSPLRLFFLVQKMEETPFMGDGSFYRLLDEMAALPEPLIRFDPATSAAEITEAGSATV